MGKVGDIGKTPQEKGVVIKNRDEGVRVLADWYLKRNAVVNLYDPSVKSQITVQMAKNWKAQGVIVHLNRGCEGTSIGVMETRSALLEAGIPVLTYEGNMGDERECDEPATLKRIDAFMESQGMNKLNR